MGGWSKVKTDDLVLLKSNAVNFRNIRMAALRPFPGVPELYDQPASCHSFYPVTSRISRATPRRPPAEPKDFTAFYDRAWLRELEMRTPDAARDRRQPMIGQTSLGHSITHVGLS